MSFLQWQAIIVTYCESVYLVLVLQHALRMHRIILQQISPWVQKLTMLIESTVQRIKRFSN